MNLFGFVKTCVTGTDSQIRLKLEPRLKIDYLISFDADYDTRKTNPVNYVDQRVI